MLTKKAKLEQFDLLNRSQNILIRYFWDSRDGVKPERKATYRTKDGDTFKASLYRTDLASGGYIVIDAKPGVPSIDYWEDWQASIHAMPHIGEFSFAMKSLAEQLRHTSSVAA